MPRSLERLTKRVPRATVNAVKYHVGRAVSWNLDALGILWGTDKARGHHGYTPYYARHLCAHRWSVRCVLEIGIGADSDPQAGGNSLRMWRSYFPRATIYGVDIYEKELALAGEARIVTLQADQSDRKSLIRVAAACPPFDLVVDDGSHIGSHIVTSFDVLFSALKPGGFYVIEDLETAYLPSFGGGPPGTPGTAAALTKSLLDELNMSSRRVAAVHAYPGLVLIEKALR
jgi:hypothetical protein